MMNFNSNLIHKVSKLHFIAFIIMKIWWEFRLTKLWFYEFRRKAEVNMEGQFLVRQIYDDEITYNLISAAVDLLRKFEFLSKFFVDISLSKSSQQSFPFEQNNEFFFICGLWWIIFPSYKKRSALSEHCDNGINFTASEKNRLLVTTFLIFLVFYLQSLLSDIPADAILELFGKTFFEFCQDSGYDKILQVLGATPRDFLQVF